MTYVVTQACCNDASCMSVCPVNCIHPAPGEPDFGTTEMVYVDPRSCIDCGACADACPVSAIKPLETLRGAEQVFGDLNAAFYADRPVDDSWAMPTFPVVPPARERPLRVAIVGTGPSASYAARELLTSSSAEVSMIDRLPVIGGLVRAGVAPDHQDTKRLTDMFAWIHDHPRTRMYLHVDVGTDVRHEDLLKHHDAVVYAVGARRDRPLDVPGEHLRGVHGAPEVVGWYNGHTDVAPDAVDVATERVVVVGNGNVSLDVARILLSDPDDLARTDISDHALAALRTSGVREVVLVGRRGPEHAAFTRPELLMMPAGIDVVVESGEHVDAAIAAGSGTKADLVAALPRVDVDWSAPPPAGRRLVLVFDTVVEEVQGPEQVNGGQVDDGRVEAVRLARRDGSASHVVPAGLVVRSTGHLGSPVPDLPFDPVTATVPHTSGRVVDPATDAVVPGTYVVGWIKRGASGGIGANRVDALETITSLLADARDGRLPAAPKGRTAFRTLLRTRGVDVVGKRAMKRIEAAERAAGSRQGRPRVKFTTVDAMLKRRPR